MIPVPSGVRVWLAVGRTDMRKGMNGLALQVQEGLKRDPHAGDLYVFRGNRGHLIKILPDYRLSSAKLFWYKPGTYDCFCGFERWRVTRSSFKRASVRLSLPLCTEQRIGAARRCCVGAGPRALSAQSAAASITASSRPARFTS